MAMEKVCELPNTCTLYREPNEVGGFRYWSDEVGGGVCVWDTCLVGEDTLLAAIVEEKRRATAERHAAEQAARLAPKSRVGRKGMLAGNHVEVVVEIAGWVFVQPCEPSPAGRPFSIAAVTWDNLNSEQDKGDPF